MLYYSFVFFPHYQFHLYLSEGKILFSGEGRDILSLSHLCKNDSVNAQRMNTRRKTIATNTAECLLLTTLVSQWTPSSSSGNRQKSKFDVFGQKQQVPHVAEESKCIDAANCQDCKTYRQSQETGVLAAKAKLFEMPVTK